MTLPRRTLLSFLPGLFAAIAVPSLVALPTQAAAPETAQQIVERVQGFYDKTKTFNADFEQIYYVRATSTKKRSLGTVVFKKKGKMSWRYTNNGNRVASDGEVIKVYEAANKQMYVQSVKRGQHHRAALSFLLGEGKLTDSFKLRKLDSKAMKFEGGYVLECEPNQKTPAYKKMLLYVDAGTAQVRRVLLLDAQGNRNIFDFKNPVVNRPVKDSEFEFTPPKGTRVIKP